MTTTYDRTIDQLVHEVERLSVSQKIALFSSIAGALLPLYREVQERTGIGSLESIENAIAAARTFAVDGSVADWDGMIEQIAVATPHGDDLDAPDSTYQQDTAIFADMAIRYAMGDTTVSAEAIEYALEPIKTTLCLAQLDRLNPGSGKEAQRWYDELPSDPKMKAGIEGLQTSMQRLLRAERITAVLIDELSEHLRVLRP
ncbi:hypothetical protein [Tahibacter soli]|uniref:Uncharacterized protein n=1 Tax=Tahibacter soli TaxID=2983605 RepID=A0A9X3YRS3_9GAMM|nr:hypothetical protein [Tahibacter soli]MDC8015166.1 hypothetical protein [Tahibacter soli]